MGWADWLSDTCDAAKALHVRNLGTTMARMLKPVEPQETLP
jgi:hypothetical protein